jgi:cation transport protein ChaC
MAAYDIAYFGYGSLVNRDTLPDYVQTAPLQLPGWQRQWKHCVATPNGKVCVLTATPRLGAKIDGVLVFDSSDKIGEIDRREVGYRRESIAINWADIPVPHGRVDTYIYVSTREHNRWGNSEFPLWRSYAECVLAGFLDVWGPAGAERFIRSTEGWEAPMLDDRAAPKYQRAIPLRAAARKIIDGLFEAHGLRSEA